MFSSLRLSANNALRLGAAIKPQPVSMATRALSTARVAQYDIQTVGVVGMGSMGHGVAQLCAQAGYNVVVTDASQKGLDHGMDAIHKSLQHAAARNVKKGVMEEAAANDQAEETMARISAGAELTHVTDSSDLIIEAIIENLDIKLEFFKNLGGMANDNAIIATNTSSFSVTEMADASGVASRFCGLHYFNPVQIMKLVEVISTEHTDPAVITSVNEFVGKTGKVAVSCGDTPGFIVNRLLVPYLAQGVGILARGDATAADIDTAMRLGAGHPMGPITLSDYVGNDITLSCMKGWIEKFPDDPSFQVPEAIAMLEEMVAAGNLGRKSGQGFYAWEGNKCVGN